MTPHFKRGDRWSKIDADDMNRISDAAWRVLDYRGGPGMTITNSPSGIRATQIIDSRQRIPRDIPVVVRDIRDGIIYVNQVTFASVALEDIRYRWIAGQFEAYPDFGHTAEEYEDFKFDGPQPTIDATYLTAHWIDGTWIVKFPAGGTPVVRAHFLLLHWTFSSANAVRDDYFWGIKATPSGSIVGDPPPDVFDPASYTPIAKPLELRRSYYARLVNGQPVSFTHPDPDIGRRTYQWISAHKRLSVKTADDTEEQWITPAYESNQVILAERVGAALTGIQTEALDGEVRDVTWLEANESQNRAWAAVQQ